MGSIKYMTDIEARSKGFKSKQAVFWQRFQAMISDIAQMMAFCVITP
jgi:hypothetical protein